MNQSNEWITHSFALAYSTVIGGQVNTGMIHSHVSTLTFYYTVYYRHNTGRRTYLYCTVLYSTVLYHHYHHHYYTGIIIIIIIIIVIMGENSVVLNIYELPMSAPDDDQLRPYASLTSFFSRILPSAGFGAYHTSLDVGVETYAYAVGGITKTPIANKHRNLPPQANFKESIVLGSISSSTTDSPSDTARCIQKYLDYLRTNCFTPTGYHLAYRNCNHFTETLATALIVSTTDLLRKRTLKSYPTWINRLARTGSTVLDQSADKTEGITGPCDVIKEARAAVGIDENSSSLSASNNKVGDGKTKNDKQRKQKKELTEAQKKMLAKLKKNPKK